MKLVIVSGQSGSGKTIALHMLEDLGYRTIDNLPVSLYKSFVENEVLGSEPGSLLAIGVDPRATLTNICSLIEAINTTRQQVADTLVLHLSTNPETLLKRYSETRRKHPFASKGNTVDEAIAWESEQLEPLKEIADIKLDTTGWSSHELRNTLRDYFAQATQAAVSEPVITVQSFGFKYGIPRSADFVFDVRCLPNPYWEPALRDFTGRDTAIQDWLGQQAVVADLIQELCGFFDRWLQTVLHADRSYVTISIGCTGGRHRSVFVSEKLQQHLSNSWPQVLIRHRELDAAASA